MFVDIFFDYSYIALHIINGRENLEIERIRDQLHRAFWKNAWHGPAVMELLTDVCAEQAAARLIPNAHTIWEIVHHIGSWKKIVERRLRGHEVHATPEEDWPPVRETTATAWRQTVTSLQQAHETLIHTFSKMSDAQLTANAPGQDFTNYIMVHGLVQHDLYHAGQISLLKKSRKK